MTVYRCCLQQWSNDLSGQGAFLHGGRWNSPGRHAIYTAENNVLAALEVALRIPLNRISKDYVMVPVEVLDSVESVSPRLPKTWNKDLNLTRHIGDKFLDENKALLMKVPSALISDAYNYIINPKHEWISKVKAGKSRSLLFDERLIKMMRDK